MTLTNGHLLYPKLSYEIIGAAMDVHNELGPGWDEWDYHRAMLAALEIRGVKAQSHLRKSLQHRAEDVDRMELDILVDDRVVLELKHIKTDFHPSHYTQIINYLKLWDKQLGLLINFGQERLRYKRIPFTEKRPVCNWVGVDHLDKARCEGIYSEVFECVQRVLKLHGIGYGADVFRKLLFAEILHVNLAPEYPVVSPAFDQRIFEERMIDAVLVGGCVLMLICSSTGGVAPQDVAILRSYIKRTSATHGLVINLDGQKVIMEGIS